MSETSDHEIMVVDISHHNTLIRSGAVESGLVGVIHKASEGSTFIDANYASRREVARSLGLQWGSYHFLRPGDMEQQMRFYLDNAKPGTGDRVVIDFEDESLSLADLRDAAAWLEALDPSLQIAIYGGHWLRDLLGNDYDEQLARYALWIAHYTSAAQPDWPQGTWPAWSLWQYTDGTSGGDPKQIEGVDGPYDCNAFNGSRENCVKWFGPPVPVPAPPPEGEVNVRVNITGPEAMQVTVIVNGAERRL